MMAVAVGAGASNAAGQSTTATVISGLASFSVALWVSSRRQMWVSSKRRKVRFLLAMSIALIASNFALYCKQFV